MGKSQIHCFIDDDIKLELDRRRLADKNFSISPLVNSLLRSWIDLGVVSSDQELELLDKLEDAKRTIRSTEEEIQSITVKLTQIKSQKVEEQKADTEALEKKKRFAKAIIGEVLK